MTASIVRPLLAAAVTLALAACAIPPKPERPPLRAAAPLAGVAAQPDGRWPEAEWWTRYGDDQLDALERQALAGAPVLAEARTRFGAALRAIELARAAGGLSAQASAQVQRQRLSEHGLIPPQFLGFTWYNQGDLGLAFQYDFDFWGKNRAAVAAAVDEAHAAAAERSSAALLLTSAVADTYFGWQADQARLALANDTVAALQRVRALTAQRVARGIELPDSLHQADAQVAAARELAAAYAGSAPIRLAALAALLGVAPAELPTLAARPLPAVDAALPADAGLDLLARRPDIAASRWRVEAALAGVEQARAAFYPDISLGAMVGLSSIDLGKLLTTGSRVAGFGPALHLPVFSHGRLRAAYGISQAELEAAAAQYDATVVEAARDVATQALTLQQLDARAQERAQQVAAAERLVRTTAARVERGLSDDRSRLAATVDALQQRDAAVTLAAQALSAQVALTKALGGGYRMTPVAAGATVPSLSANPEPR
ncbi:MAG: efflux transporter outer membrane subunit [Rhodanobacteraceae bacterium]|jgi:multidrug efflux system outer membrane protein|nr:efflux transporter outer membrane subunit [Rhodanobacteraceae bacterium]